LNAAQASLLIVDDNEDNRYTLTRRLQREGYVNLTSAEDGQQALDLLVARPFDLVLLDVMMPGLNGYQVLERVRADKRLRHIPVIMISALDEIDSVIRCIELGAEDYLSKPFNPTLLRARVGASLEKKRLRDDIVSYAQRMERELDKAREIQLSMVPREFPVPTPECPLEVFATLEPARQTGGDLYDCFWIAPGKLCLAVGDVSDKGASAALYMARTKGVVRVVATALSQEGRAPAASDLMKKANEELSRDNAHTMFVTLFLCIMDAATGRLEWCNAGHSAPFLVAPGNGITKVAMGRSIPVGVQSALLCCSGTVDLDPGACLFLYTDGVTEAENEREELFGDERLAKALRSAAGGTARDIVRSVLDEVRAFAGSAPPSDDIAALACRWRA
jgi:sigma-B regulation protein RsbU (phosphoserine phosphatase)